MLGAELWADEGLRESGATASGSPSLHDQALSIPAGEFTTEVVDALVRAAYSVGYYRALTDAEPLTYADAMTRRDQLALAVPVS